MNKYKQYEIEKTKLQNTCKSNDEYEKAIKELIKKLKL